MKDTITQNKPKFDGLVRRPTLKRIGISAHLLHRHKNTNNNDTTLNQTHRF